MQGRVACCNVLSDLYAIGIDQIDTVLMVLGISMKMNEKQRAVVTSLMIQGYDDCCKEAGTKVQGGQTVMNPWPMIGGVGIAACSEGEFIIPKLAKAGDVLVITKLLGTQLAVNAKQWCDENSESFNKIKELVTKEEVDKAFLKAEEGMATLNLQAAISYRKYQGKACTDITGFGIKGHADNLVEVQNEKVDFLIKKLPVIKNMVKLDKVVFDFKFMEGYSAETSGGFFAVFPAETAQKFVDEMIENSQYAIIAGDVVEGSNKAVITEDVEIIEFE